jgi:hypothetical protein
MSDIRRRGLVADIGRRLALRNLDELRVIDALLVRIEKGAEYYGPLDLAQPRDWRRERSEELLDAMVYDVMDHLARRDRERAAAELSQRTHIDPASAAAMLELRDIDMDRGR